MGHSFAGLHDWLMSESRTTFDGFDHVVSPMRIYRLDDYRLHKTYIGAGTDLLVDLRCDASSQVQLGCDHDISSTLVKVDCHTFQHTLGQAFTKLTSFFSLNVLVVQFLDLRLFFKSFLYLLLNL